MFSKIRNRLIVLNSIVFFIILASFGIIIYSNLRHQLYEKVDTSIIDRAHSFHDYDAKAVFLYNSINDSPIPSAPLRKQEVSIKVLDPRIFLILWNDQGTPIPLTPIAKEENAVITRFGQHRSAKSPETVTINGHVYRMFTLNFTEPQIMKINTSVESKNILNEQTVGRMVTGTTTSERILSIQAISNVDSEQNMLQYLFRLMLFGIIFGGAAVFLAGRYLANQALMPIRRSWEKQQQFVADASHELRMPLSIILANSELVFRHPDKSILDMSEPLSMVLQESKRMAKLTDQLLTLARSDSDQEEMLLKPTSLEEVIRDVIQKFMPLMELKNVHMEIDLTLPLLIQGDRERLHQLLVILLDNSLKYTQSGGSIRVNARKNGHHTLIVVEDTGSGISPEDLPYIFDRFYRGDKTRTHSNGGTGLGLAIAKWIVNKHGGTIFSESQLEKGTTMTIQLPSGHK